MYYIEQKYGNDGFATWIKILRQLAVTEYHYLNLGSKPQVMFLSAKCKVSEETLLAIIQDLCDMGEFETFLWAENRVIFSIKFVAHVQDAYAKRSNKCIDLPGLLLLLEGLGVRKPHTTTDKLPLKGPVNPQSKEEYTKENETKGESVPALEEIKNLLFGESEKRWADEMKRLYGAWGADEFDKCYQHHNNGPAPPIALWQWKQKFGTWLSIKQKNENGIGTKTKGNAGQKSAQGNGQRTKWDWNV